MPKNIELLNRLNLPDDYKTLSFEQKKILAEEIRSTIIEVVAKNGGHLAPSLGVVELSLALLDTFDLKKDKIIWDVGHQAYAWKILTGRYHNFHTLRKRGGISGFPKRSESEYDCFGVGHSSTSISAALGMAKARDLSKEDHHIVAIIGDGSLTAGLAFEALNLAATTTNRLIVVLNDNNMSISHNVGSLSLFLSRNLSSNFILKAKKNVRDLLLKVPAGDKIFKYVKKVEQSFKSFFTPGMLFEAFGFNYIGPVDGHDLNSLEHHLKLASKVNLHPVLLHVQTKKGKGYEPAEKNPIYYHGVGQFELETGLVSGKSNKTAPSYTEVFGQTLCKLATQDDKIIAITAAMPEGTGTNAFQEKFPERFVDVGICEQHAITFAAGLATQGLKPFVAIYSTFLQRAYDQIVHDMCLQNLPVILCVDRAGLVGEDGPTHHGSFDISFLRHIPNMNIISPRNENELQNALYTALHLNKPIAVRYSRGAGVGVALDETFSELPYAQGEILIEGNADICIIAIGNRVHPALDAAEFYFNESGIQACIFDARWVKPLPEEQIIDLCTRYSKIVLIEENALAGGFCSAVCEFLIDKNIYSQLKITRLGLQDKFIEHGNQRDLRALQNICVDGIIECLSSL